MLLKLRILAGVVDGSVDLAFRRWKRPTVKAGGSLRTRSGVLEIQAVDVVDLDRISQVEAKRAGYASLAELVEDLNARREGTVYRIRLSFGGADPRLELRQNADLSDEEIQSVCDRLKKMDQRSQQGPWTGRTLQLIAKHPGKLAAELAELMGMEKKPFKANVRKLKELGLTESLKIGYRLSPRGEVVFRQVRKRRKK